MNVLGISAFYHDSAACLVRDVQLRMIRRDNLVEEGRYNSYDYYGNFLFGRR